MEKLGGGEALFFFTTFWYFCLVFLRLASNSYKMKLMNVTVIFKMPDQ